MKFDGVNFAVGIFDGGDGVLCATDGTEARWESDDVIAVTVPDAQGVGKLGEELRFVAGVFDVQHRAAVLTTLGRFHFPAQMMGEPLHAVADSEDRDAEGEDIYVAFGGLRVVDGAGTAGEDDAGGFEFADFVERGGAWEYGREDLLFPDAAGD